jgi:hypothetical protein
MSNPNLLEDFIDIEPFAAQVKRDPRTVHRWMNAPDGLPYARIGNRLLIHVPSARDWLLGKLRRPNPPRRGARLRKQAAAS